MARSRKHRTSGALFAQVFAWSVGGQPQKNHLAAAIEEDEKNIVVFLDRRTSAARFGSSDPTLVVDDPAALGLT